MLLQRRLGVTRALTLGCLESIWHFAARFTPQGNIGKYSDSAIEAWVDWEGPPGQLITSLVEAGWVDTDPLFRLVVHDWSVYADEMVHTTLARSCQRFADGSAPKSGRLNQHERERFRNWVDQPEVSPETETSPEKPADIQISRRQNQPEVSQGSASLATQSAIAPLKSASAPKPVPEPVPVPVPDNPPYPPWGVGEPAGAEKPTGELAAVAAGYERHLKHHRDEPRDLVIQHVISLGDKFDQVTFNNRHGPYCDFYDRKGWDFCTLSMLAWIRAGMPPPPKAAARGRSQNEEVIEKLREKFGGESDAR
jgi:hypothetical protein